MNVSRTTLQTERLLLRPFEAGDAPAYYAYMSDPEVTRYTATLPLSREQSQKIMDNLIASQTLALPGTPTYAFAVALRAGGALIGNCRFAGDREHPDQAEVAYFFSRRVWNQGYASEAVCALIAYGFETLSLKRIVAYCIRENIGSRRVMEKAGMQPDTPVTFYASQGNFYQGEFRDVTYLRYAVYGPEKPVAGPIL